MKLNLEKVLNFELDNQLYIVHGFAPESGMDKVSVDLMTVPEKEFEITGFGEECRSAETTSSCIARKEAELYNRFASNLYVRGGVFYIPVTDEESEPFWFALNYNIGGHILATETGTTVNILPDRESVERTIVAAAKRGMVRVYGGYIAPQVLPFDYVEKESVKVINCTPHTINLIPEDSEKQTFEPSGNIVRVTVSQEIVNGPLPMVRTVYGDVVGLPLPVTNTIYIVSGMVLSALAGSRLDIIAPDTSPVSAIRNEAGQIIGVKRFTI